MSTKRFTTKLVTALAVLLFAIVSAAPVLARRRLPKIVTAPKIEYQPPWLAMLYAAIFVAGICVVGFKRAGRTHMD